MTLSKESIFSYVTETYSIKPDYPFKKHPSYAVLRHNRNNKWFGLVMNVAKSKLGLDGLDELKILVVKVNPELISILRTQPGFLPAYHMNKDHWLTIDLTSDIDAKTIFNLVDESYSLTK